jgi:hypothetical protein
LVDLSGFSSEESESAVMSIKVSVIPNQEESLPDVERSHVRRRGKPGKGEEGGGRGREEGEATAELFENVNVSRIQRQTLH